MRLALIVLSVFFGSSVSSVAAESTPSSIANGKAISKAWTTPVYLVFCRHGNHSLGNQIVAHVFFRPPPATPSVRLMRLVIRLVARGPKPSKSGLKSYVDHPTELIPAKNSSGLAVHEFRSLDFACATDCDAYHATVKGLSFTDHLHCVDCRTSSTPEGCAYYPNGTSVYAGSASPDGIVNCSNPPELRELTRCMSTASTADQKHFIWFILSVCVTVGVILGIAVTLCWRRIRRRDEIEKWHQTYTYDVVEDGMQADDGS